MVLSKVSLGVTTGEYGDPLVSMDFKGDPRSSIIDLTYNMVMGGTWSRLLPGMTMSGVIPAEQLTSLH